MSDFQSVKVFAAQVTDLAKDALHIYVGMAVFLLAAILFRRSLSEWRPIAAVVFAAFAGEIWDLIDTYSHGGTPKFAANWKDVWNTMFWPAILFGLARFTRILKR